MQVMTYALVATALMNAVATILQRLGVEDAPPETTLHWSLIRYAIHRKVWLAGFAGLTAGFLLQATALHYGTLSVVQPILTLELPFLVAILGFWIHKHLTYREWAGSFCAAAGLAAFLIFASPQPGSGTPSLATWALVAGSVTAVTAIAVCLTLVGSPAWQATMFGVAAAVMFAFTASLIKQVTDDLATGWSGLFLNWHVYAMAATGILGVFLTQNAFHVGPVTASQAALVIVDPLVSIAIGITLFGDQIQTSGPRGVFESLALIVMFTGGFFLARSPLVAIAREEESDGDGSDQLRARQPL
jgi:drug/metabolite transporter (DMT)-like permease